jgi:hypothetical protein
MDSDAKEDRARFAKVLKFKKKKKKATTQAKGKPRARFKVQPTADGMQIIYLSDRPKSPAVK